MKRYSSTFAHNIFPPSSTKSLISHLQSLSPLKIFFHSRPPLKYLLLQIVKNSYQPYNMSLDNLIEDIVFGDSDQPNIMSLDD